MPEFLLKEYKKEKNNAKMKVFIEFLYESIGENNSEEFEDYNFTLMNEDDLIDSLEYYISKNSVTSQGTATNYVANMTEFFKMLLENYNIKNEIFSDISRYNQFLAKTKLIINKLKRVTPKGIASDDQYESLVTGMDEYLKRYINIEQEMYIEISKDTRCRIYPRFVSIIAVQLKMKYAISNSKLVTLEIHDFDKYAEKLYVNDIPLHLDNELIVLFDIYLRVREYILKRYSIQESKLLIKHTGEPYTKESPDRKITPDNAILFIFVKDCINNYSGDLFSDRKVLEMLNTGINITTITKLSECSFEKCIQLLGAFKENEDENIEEINNYFNKKTVIIKKGYFKCPCCGKVKRAISNEWVLVQYGNDTTKHLVCRGCKGKNE